jgi:hypothetical protein
MLGFVQKLHSVVSMCHAGPDWRARDYGTASMCGCQRRGAEQLVAIAGDRNRPRKDVERARIVRALADRQPGRRRASASAGQRTRKPGKAPIA